jgi:hypothetical protein
VKDVDFFFNLPVFYLPIEVEFLNNEAGRFNKRIIDFVENFNKMRI